MGLADYFQVNQGIGILATADANGKVDMAIYDIPHVLDDTTIGLNMLQRLSYKNLQSNPHAAYMFIEAGTNWNGKRFYLTKMAEQTGDERVRQLRSQGLPLTDPDQANKHFVTFRIDNVRPFVGDSN